jgi:replicative DNA helicase
MEQMAFARDEGSDINPLVRELATPINFDHEVQGFDSAAQDFVERLADFNSDNSLIIFEHEALNRMCAGVRRGTLNIICTGTNVGKSLAQQDFAAGYLRQGLNVLYFSGELKAGSVANRVMANLADTSIDKIKTMKKAEIANIWSRVPKKVGRLMIHEYSTGVGNVIMFRSLTDEFKNRNGFSPDVIFVDHIQNCKPAGNATGLNLYQTFGLVAKELRQLAQELDIPVWSAAQANRQGQTGRLDLTNIGDSLQIVQDADTVLMMWRDEKLGDYVHVSVPKRREAGKGEAMFLMSTTKMKLYEPDEAVMAAYREAYERIQKDKPKKTLKKETAVSDIDRPGERK